MRLPPLPGGGGPGWAQFAQGIIGLFGQKLGRALWLWTSPTADLPTTAELGANEGALAYDDTLNTLTFYNGSAWKAVGIVGGGAALTRTDDTNVTLTLGGSPTTALLAATSITVGWAGTLAASRGGTGVSSLGNITKADDTNVTLTLGGTPTGAVITSTSFTLGWTGTLAVARGGTGSGTAAGARTNLGAVGLTGDETIAGIKTFTNGLQSGTSGGLRVQGDGAGWSSAGAGFEADYNAGVVYLTAYDRGGSLWKAMVVRGLTVTFTISGTDIAGVTSTGFEPATDNTFYLGRNDDDSPKAWKGLIMKDQGGTGKYYRLEVFDNALRIVDLTD